MDHQLKFISVNTNRLINVVACAGLLAIAIAHQKPSSSPRASIDVSKANLEQTTAGFSPYAVLKHLASAKPQAPGSQVAQNKDPFGIIHVHAGDALLDDGFLSDPKAVPFAYPVPVTMRAQGMSDMFSRMSEAWENTVIDMTHPESHTAGPTRVNLADAQSKVFVFVNEKIERSSAAKQLTESARATLSYEVALRLHTQVQPNDLGKVAAVLDSDGNQYIESYIRGRNTRVATLGIKGDTLEELEYLTGTADMIATAVGVKLEHQQDIQLTQM